MSNEIKLLPCPCCGSGTEIEIGIIARKRFIFYQAVCLECGLTAKATPTPELTASLWNTREPMDRIVEELEEKKKRYEDEKQQSKGLDRAIFNNYQKIIDKAINIVKDGGKYGRK